MNAFMLEQNLADAATLLKAMANQHRLQIMLAIRREEKCVGELEDIVGLGQSALSQHLARLRKDNLVTTRREGQTIFYSLSSGGVTMILDALCAWFATQPMCNAPAQEVMEAAAPAKVASLN
jgi:DNA-binding transcriptional ArsR family regulator